MSRICGCTCTCGQHSARDAANIRELLIMNAYISRPQNLRLFLEVKVESVGILVKTMWYGICIIQRPIGSRRKCHTRTYVYIPLRRSDLHAYETCTYAWFPAGIRTSAEDESKLFPGLGGQSSPPRSNCIYLAVKRLESAILVSLSHDEL